MSVVVPVFNNAASLPELHRRLVATLDGAGSDYEIVYVNDGSRDASLENLESIVAADEAVTVVDLERNFGQSAAILAGFEHARGDVLVTIDADLENQPEDVPSLVDAVTGGADLACGVRGGREAPLVTRRAPSWIANRLVGNALGIRLRDWGCGLNAVRSGLARRMLASDPLPRLPKIEAALSASSVVEVPVAFSPREHGRSGYTVARLAGFAFSFLLGFSPLGALGRIVRAPTGGRPRYDHEPAAKRVAAVVSGLVQIACWALLTLLAVGARIATLLSRRPQSPERYRVRSVLGRAATVG